MLGVPWWLSILGAEAGVPSLVLSSDRFGTVTPYLGYGPIGMGVE